jgi:glycine hydroxymethyltransferase
MTTRGFKKPEAERLAGFISDVLDKPADEAHLQRVANEVKALCARFPVYPYILGSGLKGLPYRV